jgi:hypothetical protein
MSKKKRSPYGRTFRMTPGRYVSVTGEAIPSLTNEGRSMISMAIDTALVQALGPGSAGVSFRATPLEKFVPATKLLGGKYNTLKKIARAVDRNGITCRRKGRRRWVDEDEWYRFLARDNKLPRKKTATSRKEEDPLSDQRIDNFLAAKERMKREIGWKKGYYRE